MKQYSQKIFIFLVCTIFLGETKKAYPQNSLMFSYDTTDISKVSEKDSLLFESAVKYKNFFGIPLNLEGVGIGIEYRRKIHTDLSTRSDMNLRIGFEVLTIGSLGSFINFGASKQDTNNNNLIQAPSHFHESIGTEAGKNFTITPRLNLRIYTMGSIGFFHRFRHVDDAFSGVFDYGVSLKSGFGIEVAIGKDQRNSFLSLPASFYLEIPLVLFYSWQGSSTLFWGTMPRFGAAIRF